MKKKIRLGDLVADTKYQVRKTINTWIVSNLVQVLKAGLKFADDIVVDEDLHIVSGFHRYEAYKRVLDPNEKVSVDVQQFQNEQEAYLFAVKDNTTHGVPLEQFEKKEIRIQLRDNFGMDEKDISKILGISLDRFQKWDAECVIVAGKKKPLKSGNTHLVGKKMTTDEYENHRDHHTTSTAFHIGKIIERISDGTMEDDEEMADYVSHFVDILRDWLANHPGRNAA
jgi:DNA-binding transcriptional regulator YiaG